MDKELRKKAKELLPKFKAVAKAQRRYWDALSDLESALGFVDIDDPGDMTELETVQAVALWLEAEGYDAKDDPNDDA